jgi:hypothetical protein
MPYFLIPTPRAAIAGMIAAFCLVFSGCSGQETPGLAQSETPTTGTEPSNAPQTSGPTPLAAAELAAIRAMTIPQLMNAATQDANDMADVLAGVSDEAAARAAMTKMRAMGPKIEAMAAQIDRGLEAGDVKLSLKTMNDMADFAKAQMRMVGEMGRIAEQHPELRNIITEEFEGLEIKLE